MKFQKVVFSVTGFGIVFFLVNKVILYKFGCESYVIERVSESYWFVKRHHASN